MFSNELDHYNHIEHHETMEIDDFFDSQAIMNYNIKNESINILHMNIRSMRKNFEQFSCYLNRTGIKYQIVLLSETWITDEHDCNYELNGYSRIDKIARYSRSDGLCMFIDNTIKYDLITDLIEETNSIIINCVIGSRKLIIVGLYRSPSLKINEFINGLDSCLDNLNPDYCKIIIGDINIDLLGKDRVIDEYLYTLQLKGYKSFINKPTRIQNNSSSCLDHIFFKG